jgi:DNA polymerase-3 subunit epsilon
VIVEYDDRFPALRRPQYCVEVVNFGEKIFKALSARANEITSRICAVGSPFDKKDLLKQRGYSWYDGSKGGSKAWWTTVPYEKEQEELDFLAREIYPGGKTDSVEISRIDAFSRFSDREA